MTGRRGPRSAETATAPNTWTFPEQRILYTQLPKNACTSIKQVLAEVSGQDTPAWPRALCDEASRRMLVHKRRLWDGAFRLTELTAQQRSEISPDNGWFVFAVVRDPRLRAWSAWQSKFLVGDPVYVRRRFPDADWLPRVPQSADDVLEDWRTFVDALSRGDGPVRDGHFRPQAVRLLEDQIPYTRIYEMREIPEMLKDLGEHVSGRGIAGELSMPRENDTPLSAGREVFTEGVLEKLDAFYASDLERFGHLWDIERTLAKPVAWDDGALRGIAPRVALGERIADLYEIGRRERSRRREAESQLAVSRAATMAASRGGATTGVAAAPASALASELGRRAGRRLSRLLRRA